MCGFAGFLRFGEKRGTCCDRADWLQTMGRQLARRGPDDEQFWIDNNLSFVFRRLAIVDVVGGQQPIWNETGTIFVAVNGEIYNHLALRAELRECHSFRTHSDAEVMLHLYEERGPEALQLLNGMFAIAIWDTQRQQLFLARDRLGIKPLYYSHVGDQLLFGSELKAIIAHPDCPNQPNWHDLKVPMPRSSYVSGVDMLPAGHYLIYDQTTQTAHPVCYWSLEQHFVTQHQADHLSPQDYAAQYGDLLADSVQQRLMSDVPIGAFLSGGLDSSTMTAIAARYAPDLSCFTVIEPCTILTGDAAAAQQLSQHLQVPCHPVQFDPQHLIQQLNFSLSQFEYFVWMMDAPKFSLEWFFKHELHRYAKTICPDLKVMLLGQGADEFAGGYSNPAQKPLVDWDAYVTDLKDNILPMFFAGRNLPESWTPWISEIAQESPPPQTNHLFHGEMLRRTIALQVHNLWHEDRTAASQGIESRVPFLDHRLVELLASIPSHYHAELFWDKAIIRQVAQRWLPESLAQRSKVGFFYAADNLTSIEQLMRQFLLGIFPEFSRKYLDLPEMPFSKTRMLELFHEATTELESNFFIFKKLLNCMAMTIFASLCQRRFQDPDMEYLNPPSPLKTDPRFIS